MNKDRRGGTRDACTSLAPVSTSALFGSGMAGRAPWHGRIISLGDARARVYTGATMPLTVPARLVRPARVDGRLVTCSR